MSSNYPLERGLNSRHRAIMRMLVSGFTQHEIAEILDLTDTTVSLVVNSDIFKVELAKMHAECDQQVIKNSTSIRSRIDNDLANLSIKELENMLKDEKNVPFKVRADIAMDILDRAGFKPIEKKEIQAEYTHTLQSAYEKRKQELARREQAISEAETLLAIEEKTDEA